MKKTALVLTLAGLVMLAGCDSTKTPTSSGVDTSTPTTSNSGVSSDVVKYIVRINAPAGVTITSDKEKAATGETVNLTITLASGYTLTSLTMNGTALTPTDGKASFVMPNRDVAINATVAIDGDVTLAGGVAALFVKEGNLYVARGVTFTNRAEVYVAVKGTDGTITKVGHGHLNPYKCFGSFELGSGSNHEESTVSVGGNASYDFYYDPSAALSLYIQRVAVTSAPSNASQYEDLFDSNVHGGQSTMYPEGVVGVTHWDSRDNLVYSYSKYENNVSYATVKEKGKDDVKAVVYKSYKDNVYTLVDTYVEGAEVQDPYRSGNVYIDDTKMEDDAAISGKYLVSDSVEEGFQDFDETARYHTKDNLEWDAGKYSHDIESLDRQQHEGYRTGFSIEDDLTKANVTVTSKSEADGSFTTTIDSYKCYTPSSSSSTYKTMTSDTYIAYKIVTSFTKSGAPLSGTYSERKYDNTAYNFATNTFIGDPATTGVSVKETSFTYTYGNPLTGAPSFDTTPYFATSIAPSIKGSLGTNSVNGGELINDAADDLNMLEPNVAPATALDGWEYGILSSSDTSIIAEEPNRSNHVYRASLTKTGTSTLTIGNFVDNKVTATVDVSVSLTKPKRFHIESLSSDDSNLVTANACWVLSKNSYTAKLGTTPDNASLAGISFLYSQDIGLACNVNEQARTITFDTTKCNVTANTKVTVTLVDPNYDTSWVESDSDRSTIDVTVYPAVTTKFSDTYIVGDWLIDADTRKDENDKTTVKLTSTAYSGTNTTYQGWSMGEIDLDGDVFTFAYKYNAASYSIKVGATKQSGTTYAGYDWYYVNLACEVSSNKLLGMVYGEKDVNNNGENEVDYTDFAGTYAYDEDGNFDETNSKWVAFDKVAA
jgi:hypothetical protein